MVTEDILAAQKSILKGIYIKGYSEFMSCQKGYCKRPELVILSDGRHYVDGLTSCKRGYCSHCVKSYLFKAGLEVAKAEEFIQQEKLCPTMITFSVPHKATDSLKHLRLTMDRAVRGFLAESKNKLVKKINQSVGNEGYVLRNEITYTSNGWNTHCHVLNLNRDNYSEEQKDLLIDEFARQLENSGFYFSRLDRYNIENKSHLLHFRENSSNLSYLTKFDNDNPVNLVIDRPEQYIEFAQSFNIATKIPLVKFKNGLKSKISRSLNLSDVQTARELKRIEIPEFLVHQPLDVIKDYFSVA